MLVLAALLRVWALGQALPAVPLGDENYYVGVASNLAAGEGHVAPDRTRARAAWPPGQAFALSLFVDPTRGASHKAPERSLPLLWLEVVLGTALVALVIALGAALFDARTGLVAGAVAAAYPTFIAYSHYLWSTTLFALLLTGALVGVAAARPGAPRAGQPAIVAATGILFGLAALTREIALPLAWVCAGWWVWLADARQRRGALLRALALVVLAAAVVLPWSVRNYALFGRLVPVSTVGWMGLREGNVPARPDWLGSLAAQREHERELNRYRIARTWIADELARMDADRAEALALIAAAQPGWLAHKLRRNLPDLFGPDSALFYKIRRGRYPHWNRSAVRAALVVTVAAYVVVFVAGVLGIAVAGAADGPGVASRGRTGLALLLFGVLLAVHVAAQAGSRYRVPLMPVLIVYAGYACVHGRVLRRHLVGARRLAAGLVLLVFFGLCLPSITGTATRLWQSGGGRPPDADRAQPPIAEPTQPPSAEPTQP